MERPGLLAILSAIGTVIIALASHGEDAVSALLGVPALLQAWASGLPLGAWSFIVALSLSVLVWVYSIRYLPVGKDGKAPFGQANVIALMVGLMVAIAQQLVADHRTAGGLLNAFWIGSLAGLLGPQIGTLLRGKART